MFRPCIDIHEGRVKQIVGGSLSDSGAGLRTNFVSTRPAAWYAKLYREDQLRGGHVIMLGPGCEEAARSALAAYPKGLQIGGGITSNNAAGWLEQGASHVIVTSWVFREGRVDWERLADLVRIIGREQLVIDLSCRVRDGRYFVVTDRWQKFTSEELGHDLFARMAECCAEFLVHAADVEGLCRGIDLQLVRGLAEWSPIPATYAGGAKSLEDLTTVWREGRGRVHLTIGSALDIFGGSGVAYADAVALNRSLAGNV
ncbi:MAG: phosphoribosylformimino-5-aminoimidazole carboxamide ribotide isomerase [Verrucomicrobia bacterium]|nr:phosphoribosylformimino-5-aminoimidazole carboxamide ribotide isomerase [Verrucomicrobiota bacterium]